MPLYYLVYILAILGLEVLLVGLIWLWWRALKQQQEAFHSATRDTYTELTKIVQKTTAEAEKVMEEALKTAARLQLTAHKHVEEVEQQTVDLLSKQSSWHETTLQRLLEKYQTDIGDETRKNIQMVQQLMKQRLDNLDVAVAQELRQTTLTMRDTLKVKLETTEQEIEAYRLDQVRKLDQKSEQILGQVVKELLGKTLSPADHHQLVKNAFKQALAQPSIEPNEPLNQVTVQPVAPAPNPAPVMTEPVPTAPAPTNPAQPPIPS